MLKSTSYTSAEDYDKSSKQFQQKDFFELISSIKIQPGFKCLDIGCGSGNNTAMVAEQVGNQGIVIGVDPDEKRIELAQRNYNNIRNLKLIVAKSTDFPFYDGGYDLILSNLVMHWVQHKEKFATYQRVYDALKPGGIFALLELSRRTEYTRTLISHASPEISKKINNSIFVTSPETTRELLTGIGFEIMKFEEFSQVRSLESLPVYFKWLDATFHGMIDTKGIYEAHKDVIKLKINEDGSVDHLIPEVIIIVKKPA